MNDVIVPLAPINQGKIRAFVPEQSFDASHQQIELDITDEYTSVIIRVPRHQMLIEISANGIFIKSEPMREVKL